MPSQDLKGIFDKKPLQFTIKTAGGKWQCTLHGDRNAYEKTRDAAPEMVRTGSDMSVASTASSSSSSSH